MISIGINLKMQGGSPPTSADAWVAAVNAAGASVPAALKTAVAAALDDPVFAKVIDFALFAGPSTIAGALVPVRSSASVLAWPSSGLDANDYIATGIDCGINSYRYIEFAGVADGPAPKVLNTGAIAMNAVGGFLVVGSGGVNPGGGLFVTKGGDHPRLYQGSVTNAVGTAYSFGGTDYLEGAARLAGDTILVRESTTSARLYQNGTSVVSAAGASISAPTAGEFRLQIGVGANTLGARTAAFVVFNNATFAEALQIRTRVMAVLSSISYITGISTYLAVGDSQAAGFGVPSWTEVVRASRGGRHLNAGLNGRIVSEVVSLYASQAKFYRPDSFYSTAGWYLPFVATNDLRAGTAGATLYTAIQAHWAAAVADGWKVGKFTVLPRSDAGWTGAMETERTAFNTAVRGDATAGTTLVDVAACPGLNNPADGVNYQSDQLHLSAAGNVVLGNFITPILV